MLPVIGLHNMYNRVLPFRTGEISYAHLRCAAEGEGAAARHAALAWLISPSNEREFEAALEQVGAIGHTSGWDALTGAAMACAAWTAWR